MENDCLRSCWTEINLTALSHNLKEIKRNKAPGSEIMAVVKANAYGHGVFEVVNTALEHGVNYFGVAIPEEGIELRQNGIKQPILVLGGILPEQAKLVAENDLTQTVFTPEIIKALDEEGAKLNKKIKVHIKIDTGMGRIGVRDEQQLTKLLECIFECKYVIVEGVFTHFSVSDIDDKNYTIRQFELFNRAVKRIRNAGIYPKYLHAANSGAIIAYPQTHLNMIRSGIIMYGYHPSKQISKKIDIMPVLEWKAKIIYLKTLPPGQYISYGKTFVTKRPTKIATVAVGYADGYNRLLSNKGYMIVNGKKAPVVGRICMDQCMVDVTDIEHVKIGDTVILIGSQDNQCITAYDLADICGTIPYEILTSISSRVARIIKK